MSQSTTYNNKLSHFFALLKQSLRGGEHDYTKGSIRGAIVLLAIPMILELCLESVFALVDMYFVGHLEHNSENAIATVGLTESVVTIVYSIAIGLSTAATAMVARRVGEKNIAGAAHAGMQAIIMSLVITVVISIAGIIFAPDILRLMGATPEVIRDGVGFTRIMLGGSVVIILLFLINGIFRGAGDAAMAMRSLWIASLLNIFLCPMLIYGYGPFPELGLEGAAIATTIGRGIGVAYQCYHLFYGKKSVVKLNREHFQFDWPLLKSLAKIAWPATFQFIIASGSWIVLVWIVSTTGGRDASAGYQVAIRNVVFFILPAWGFSNAAAALVGQNLGAKQPERAAQSVLLTAKYNAIFMAFVTILFVFFSTPIVSIFNDNPNVQAIASEALMIIGTGYIFYGIGMVMIQALNGAGDTRTPTILNFICFWLIQIPLGYILAKTLGWGPTGAFIALPVSETILAILGFYYFKKGKWKEVKV
jgi:putative MATE family efflux protein